MSFQIYFSDIDVYGLLKLVKKSHILYPCLTRVNHYPNMKGIFPTLYVTLQI